jgi:aminomethyltransferase
MSAPELPPDQEALRTATALARTDRTRIVRLRGEGAREAALWLLPSRLHLRDAQARQSLLLDERGRPIADVLVCADDEDYLLLLDGPGDPVAHVRAHARGDVEIQDLSADHEVIELHGPWAWELVAEVLGPDLVALPYLSFFRLDEGLCVRAGRTGEFGYHLVAPRTDAPALAARFLERGEAFGVREIGADALSLAMFESWFFDAHHVPEGATPLELQLQWRLAPDRDHLGRDAIERRRAERSEVQVCLLSAHEMAPGDPVTLAGRFVGRVTRAARSPVCGAWMAAALVELRLGHGGIDRLRVRDLPARTASPPLVDNRSLYVDPRRHSFRTRDEIAFGSLVRAPRAQMEPA